MAQEHQAGEGAPSVSALRRIGKNFPKDGPSRFIAVYLGVGIIISFLFVASLAPQLGEKLGNLSARKTGQQSEAGYNRFQNTIIFDARPSSVKSGAQTLLGWNASSQNGYIYCNASGASEWSGRKSNIGTQLVTPQSPQTTYTITCKNRRYSALDTKTVTVPVEEQQSGGVIVPQGAKTPPCFVPGREGVYGYGDADGNGYVNKADSELILKAVVGLTEGQVLAKGTERFEVADVNNDNQITSVDALLIQRFLNGSISTFDKVCPAKATQSTSTQSR